MRVARNFQSVSSFLSFLSPICTFLSFLPLSEPNNNNRWKYLNIHTAMYVSDPVTLSLSLSGDALEWSFCVLWERVSHFLPFWFLHSTFWLPFSLLEGSECVSLTFLPFFLSCLIYHDWKYHFGLESGCKTHCIEREREKGRMSTFSPNFLNLNISHLYFLEQKSVHK